MCAGHAASVISLSGYQSPSCFPRENHTRTENQAWDARWTPHPGFLCSPCGPPGTQFSWQWTLDSLEDRLVSTAPDPLPGPVLSPLRGWTSQPPSPAQHRITKPIWHDPPLFAAPSTGTVAAARFGSLRALLSPGHTAPGDSGARDAGGWQLSATQRTAPPGQLLITLQNPGRQSPCLGGHGCPGACWAE